MSTLRLTTGSTWVVRLSLFTVTKNLTTS
jgi:hypothetical protein